MNLPTLYLSSTPLETPLPGSFFCYNRTMKIKLDAADKVFSQYIRTRDNWQCQRCKKTYIPPTTALHCSHFQGRGKEATRFDPDNCCALCMGCHQYFTAYPAEHYLWQVKRLGQNKVNALIVRSNTYKKKDRKMELIRAKELLKSLMK